MRDTTYTCPRCPFSLIHEIVQENGHLGSVKNQCPSRGDQLLMCIPRFAIFAEWRGGQKKVTSGRTSGGLAGDHWIQTSTCQIAEEVPFWRWSLMRSSKRGRSSSKVYDRCTDSIVQDQSGSWWAAPPKMARTTHREDARGAASRATSVITFGSSRDVPFLLSADPRCQASWSAGGRKDSHVGDEAGCVLTLKYPIEHNTVAEKSYNFHRSPSVSLRWAGTSRFRFALLARLPCPLVREFGGNLQRHLACVQKVVFSLSCTSLSFPGIPDGRLPLVRGSFV